MKKTGNELKASVQKKGSIIAVCTVLALLLVSAFVSAQDDTIALLADIPVGGIIMFTGDEFDYDAWGYLTVDERFHVCNGLNGTLDLQHSYVAGYDPEEADYDTIGETFGNDTYNLTVSQLPSHRHSYIDWYPGFRTQSIVNGNSLWCDSIATRNTFTGYTGSNSPIDNRPYTTVVNFIQRIA